MEEEKKEIMTGIYKIKDGCYLKEKSWFGEPFIFYPVKDLETGKINIKNLLIGGSWARFIEVLLILLILVSIILAYQHDIAVCKDLIKNPYKCCNLINWTEFEPSKPALNKTFIPQNENLPD